LPTIVGPLEMGVDRIEITIERRTQRT